MFWKLTLSYLFLTLARFILIAHRGIKLQATFSGNNAIRPKGNQFPPHHPCVRAREGAVRARACVGVHLCVCACKRECLSPSLARHAPLLLSSSTRASTLPLILEMRSSSPGPQYASLVLLCLTRPSCRAPFLLCDRAVQRLCAGDLSLARVRRTRPRGRPGRGGRSTSTRSQVRDLCACACVRV